MSKHKTASAAKNQPSQVRLWPWAVLLVVATAVAYWPVYRAEFVDFDDSEYVHGNVHVATGLSFANLRWAFTALHSLNWHPLTWISHMLDVELFGLYAPGHHVTSVVLHAANCVLLCYLLHAATGRLGPSVCVAALFAIHPINVESVAWISQRKTTLSTLFGLLSLGAYGFYVRRGNRRAYLASLALFACSLMAKQTLVTLGLVLLLVDYWPLGRPEFEPPHGQNVTLRTMLRGVWRLLPEKLPYLLLAAGASVLTVRAQQAAIRSIELVPLDTRIGNVVISYVAYLGQAVWPVHLAAFYPLYNEDVTAVRVLGAGVVLVGITVACWLIGRRQRWLLAGWLWYLVTMLPVIGIVHVGSQSRADRYAYLSFWGLWVIVAWGGFAAIAPAAKRIPARRLLMCGASVVGMFCIALTMNQASKWRNTIALFEDAVADTDRNWVAYKVLAEHYLNRGDYARCIDYARRGKTFGRAVGRMSSSEGMALMALGQVPQAIEQLEVAARYEPNGALIQTNLGWAYSQVGAYPQAIAALSKAAGLLTAEDTPYAWRMVYANWANALVQSGQLDEAAKCYDVILQRLPDDALLLAGAGQLDLRLGQPERAIERLRRAAEIEPRPGVYRALAEAFAARQQWEQAIAAAEQAVQLAQQQNDEAAVRVILGELNSYRNAARTQAAPTSGSR